MATDKTAHSYQDRYIAFAMESTFGTAIADDQNFTKLKLVSASGIPSFNPDIYEDTEMKNRGLQLPDVNDYFTTANNRWQRYQIPEFYAPSDVAAKFFYMALQQVSEAALTPYVKTYTVDGDNHPDFSSNAGAFMTLLIGDPIASQSQKLTSCVVETLNWRLDPDNGGRLIMSATVITGKGYSNSANPSGTNSFSTVTVPSFNNSTRTLTINSLDLVWRQFAGTIQNQWGWVGYSSGNAENYRLMSTNLAATAIVKYDPNSDVFRQSKGSDINATVLTIGANNAAGYLKLNADNTILRNVETEDGDDNTPVNLNLSLEFRLDQGATEYPSIEIADGVDQTW